MSMKGRVHKFGEDINTDEIIPAPYLNTTDPEELAKHCMEGIDKAFWKRVKKKDVIVAGWNFGCGSSREHAPLAIKGLGISCVVAPRFAGIFFRNAINIGLPIAELEVMDRKEGRKKLNEIKKNHLIKVDFKKGRLLNLTTKKAYNIMPYPAFLQEIINKGGLMKWLKNRRR
ncbi:3-isopropylmalate dehydratase small subunit [Omnitrophica bacterium]|nr:3-isopropylmalate dehydratase small subunit [Candidatus Omnitrophota bacterium]